MNAKSIGGNSQNCLSTRTVLSDTSVTELNEDKAELISVSTQTDNTGTIDDECKFVLFHVVIIDYIVDRFFYLHIIYFNFITFSKKIRNRS